MIISYSKVNLRRYNYFSIQKFARRPIQDTLLSPFTKVNQQQPWTSFINLRHDTCNVQLHKILQSFCYQSLVTALAAVLHYWTYFHDSVSSGNTCATWRQGAVFATVQRAVFSAVVVSHSVTCAVLHFCSGAVRHCSTCTPGFLVLVNISNGLIHKYKCSFKSFDSMHFFAYDLNKSSCVQDWLENSSQNIPRTRCSPMFHLDKPTITTIKSRVYVLNVCFLISYWNPLLNLFVQTGHKAS